MLDMGFKEEIDDILKWLPQNRQIWLFSATVKPGIAAIMKKHMKEPVSVRVAASDSYQLRKRYNISVLFLSVHGCMLLRVLYKPLLIFMGLSFVQQRY